MHCWKGSRSCDQIFALGQQIKVNNFLITKHDVLKTCKSYYTTCVSRQLLPDKRIPTFMLTLRKLIRKNI